MSRTYTIKEFEKVTGISAHTLRYFDKIKLLSPSRSDNGYRIYSLEQVSIAEAIILLQKAMFSNDEIKALLCNYNSTPTIDKLKLNQIKIKEEILNLRKVHRAISEHVSYLENLHSVRNQLNEPFIEWRKSKKVGLLKPTLIRDIVDFFDLGDTLTQDPTWPHFCTHGMIVPIEHLSGSDYPLECMYAEHANIIQNSPFSLPEGNYLNMYCTHSMESNPNVCQLLKHAEELKFDHEPYILIEQVSGPVIEKSKEEFLVKLMLVES